LCASGVVLVPDSSAVHACMAQRKGVGCVVRTCPCRHTWWREDVAEVVSVGGEGGGGVGKVERGARSGHRPRKSHAWTRDGREGGALLCGFPRRERELRGARLGRGRQGVQVRCRCMTIHCLGLVGAAARFCSKSCPRFAPAFTPFSPNTSKQKSGVGLHGGRPESRARDGVVKQVRE
jgi:hypothetical protein